LHINLTILSTKKTTLFSNGHNSVNRIVHICFSYSEKIIEILKFQTSAIWNNIQVIKKSNILSHSFTTHHLEQKYDLCYIQKLLCHSSIKNAGIYTHVTQSVINKLYNPLDEIYK